MWRDTSERESIIESNSFSIDARAAEGNLQQKLHVVKHKEVVRLRNVADRSNPETIVSTFR